MTRLREQYKSKILPDLKKELSLDNDLAAPRIAKIVINAGIGKRLQENPKLLDTVLEDMAVIAGQKPVKTRARKSIAAFKIRDGQVVGVAVTLRGKRMYEFFDKLINATFPRIRDFRGFSKKGFDGKGNYSVGLKDHLVFAELAAKETSQSFGIQIVITTTATDNDAGYLLLKKFGFPFKD